jgi:class 3 adenylate cyclase
LLVLEGDDAGRKFTVDGDQVRIGRGEPQAGRPGAILLRDPSIALEQALIQATPNGAILIDRADPGPATLLNDGPMVSRPLRVGDQIRMGRVLVEVREHRGMSVTTLFGNTGDLPAREVTTTPIDAERTEIRSKETLSSHLVLTSGIEGLQKKRFELKGARNVLGRSEECEVHLPERGVSRQHAEILLENGKLVLRHLSQVNPTFVNGAPVGNRRELRGGDEIQLADQVVLKLVEFGDSGSPLAERGRSLQEVMEDKVERDRAIEEQFAVSGSFLDVDVVDSYRLKAEGGSAELKIVSFERFRAFVADVIEDHRGQVLNSNGDELMCFFEEPTRAVRAAAALLDALPGFNDSENLLSRPFRIRCGIHTGNSLVDRDRGVAYSPVLDLSGHLQKHADVNGLLVSESTLEQLPDDLRFEEGSKLEKSGLRTFRLLRD